MSNSRTQRSLKNVAWSLLTQVILMVLGIVVRTALVTSLGMDYVGVNAALVSLIALLTIADAGMGAAVMYSMYGPLENGDFRRLRSLVLFARSMFRWVAVIVGAIGLAIIPFLGRLVGPSIDDPLLEVYFVILLTALCCNYLLMHRSLVVVADQRFYLTKIYNFSVQAVRSGLQIFILLYWGDFFAFVLAAALGTAVQAIILHWRSGKLYTFLYQQAEPLRREERKFLYASVRAMFGYRAAIRVMTNATPLLVVGMLGATVGGQYANYLLVVASALVLLDLFYQAITASLGNMVATSRPATARKVFDELNVVTFVLYGLSGLAFVHSFEGLISVWLGDDATLGTPVVWLVVLNFIAYGQMAPVMAMREATGLFRRVRFVLPATALASVLLSILLGQYWGLLGILLGVPLARFLLSNWVEPYLLIRHALHGSVWLYFARQAQFYVAVALSMLLLSVFPRSPDSETVGGVAVDLSVAILTGGVVFSAMFAPTAEGRRLLRRAGSLARARSA